MRRKNLRKIYSLTVQPEGPTGRKLDQLAEDVTDIAREYAADILARMDPVARYNVLGAIQFRRHGREIRVGIVDEGPISQYLANKELREHVWLQPALEDAMNLFPEISSAKSALGTFQR